MTPSDLSMAEQNAFNIEMHIENLKRHKSAGFFKSYLKCLKYRGRK
jgi:hypothetical protein